MDNFINNIVAGLVCAALCKFLRYGYEKFKSSMDSVSLSPKKPVAKEILRKQFFVSLILLLILWPAFFFLPANYESLIGGVKLSCLLLAALCGVIVWGAFDAACEFYPTGDVSPEPTTHPTDNTGNQ